MLWEADISRGFVGRCWWFFIKKKPHRYNFFFFLLLFPFFFVYCYAPITVPGLVGYDTNDRLNNPSYKEPISKRSSFFISLFSPSVSHTQSFFIFFSYSLHSSQRFFFLFVFYPVPFLSVASQPANQKLVIWESQSSPTCTRHSEVLTMCRDI